MKIGEYEISIVEKYYLIKGKFRKSIIQNYETFNFDEIIENINFNEISLEIIINIINIISKNHSDLEKSLYLLEFLKIYRNNTNKLMDIIKEFIKIISLLNSHLKLKILYHRKKYLENELRLSELKSISGDISAKSNLLNKLNEDIEKNELKLKYLEEDFKIYENKYKQINQNLKNLKQNIKELNIKKKECFNQINRITREFDEYNSPNLKDNKLNNEGKLSEKYKQLKDLRIKAKKYQLQISEQNKKIKDLQQKLEEFLPSYDSIKKDYERLSQIIENDKEKLNQIKIEIETQLKKRGNSELKELNFENITVLRRPEEIKYELNKINSEINNLINSINLNKNENELKLIENNTLISNKIESFKKEFEKNKEKIIKDVSLEEITESVGAFRKIESILIDLEGLLNIFLKEISLTCSFEIKIRNLDEQFLIVLSFLRGNKELLKFDDLTTPEKVFFIISFYLSLKIILKEKTIIFSNLFLPPKFNKRGSVYRTIRKVLPIFQKDKRLMDFSLIFIISNLEMKKEIEGIKIIEINQNQSEKKNDGR
ncbi:MAG: hypothetical protein ACTSQP_10045 [Promethearchaeota archaeon]